MNKFVEKNRRLLNAYCVVLRISGWILLLMGVIGFIMAVAESLHKGSVTFHGSYGMLKRSSAVCFNTGLVALGFSQLVRYLLENNRKKGWLLHYGEKIFYLYALFTIWGAIGYLWLTASGQTGGPPVRGLQWLLFILPGILTLFYKTAKALILIGLGQLLRHIMPIIEELKTTIPEP